MVNGNPGTDIVKLTKLKHLGVTAAVVRAWAADNGYQVGSRGRLSPDLIDAYVKANPRRIELPTVSPRRPRPQPPRVVVDPQPRESEWRITAHALSRMREFGFTRDEVLDTAERPEVSYASGANYGPDEMIYQRGRVALAVVPWAKVIKTALPRTQEQWEH